MLLSFVTLKDYYAILEILPSASQKEIKLAYRKMVLLYHPDKNNNPSAIVQFCEIKEAYEVLNNLTKKNLYLQKRWLYKANGKKFGEGLTTAPVVLKKCLELNKFMATSDIHRMNFDGIAQYATDLLNDDVIRMLSSQSETYVLETILSNMLPCLNLLPHKAAASTAEQLLKLAIHLPLWQKKINQLMLQKQQQEKWTMLTPLLIALLTIAICVTIWLVA